MMTIDEGTLDRPKVGTSFSVICGFCRLRLFRFTMKFSAEIFAPYGRFQNSQSLPDSFAVPSSVVNMNSSSSCLINTSFALILRG